MAGLICLTLSDPRLMHDGGRNATRSGSVGFPLNCPPSCHLATHAGEMHDTPHQRVCGGALAGACLCGVVAPAQPNRFDEVAAMTVDSIEWDKVQTMSMPGFLDLFALHDSNCHGISIDHDHRVTVEAHIDLVWNSSIPKGFDTLALRFEEPYRVRWIRGSSDMQLIVGVAKSVVLDSAERDALRADTDFQPREEHPSTSARPHPADDPSLTRTTLEFVGGDRLNVLHGGAVRVAVVDSGSRTVDVSTILGEASKARSAMDPVLTTEQRAKIQKRVREWREEFENRHGR